MSTKKKLLEQKRRAAALKKAERDQAIVRVAGIVVVAAVVAIIAGALIFDAVKKEEKNTVLDYSVGLDAKGMIKGVKAEKYVDICDFNSLNLNTSDYFPSAEEEEQYISAIVDSYPELSDKKDITVNEGDYVNIDYIGYVDGKEYEGGNTNGSGIRIQLGAKDYIEGFEEQIEGHKTGETFEITVSFPEDFGNEELAGKDADYTITINGLYVPAEFNDEFVKKNFGASVEDSADFLEKYRMSYAQDAFDTYVQNYAVTESKVKSYPAMYLSKMKKYMRTKDNKQLETSNASYQSLYGYDAYKDVLEMRGMTKAEYKKETESAAKSEADKNLIMQALFEKFGLEVTEEGLNEVVVSFGFGEDEYDQAVERFGEPYLYQQAMAKAVNNYLAETYNLIEE